MLGGHVAAAVQGEDPLVEGYARNAAWRRQDPEFTAKGAKPANPVYPGFGVTVAAVGSESSLLAAFDQAPTASDIGAGGAALARSMAA
jgi:hypothetical protein